MEATIRCPWAGDDPLMRAYHDDEWGMPSHDDRHLFEMLVLEGAQAGLSWRAILHRRAAYRVAFHDFDPTVVARFTPADVARLLGDAGIIRNRRKIEAAVRAATIVIAIQRERGSLDSYAWSFVGGRPIRNRWKTLNEIPAQSEESAALSAALRARGCAFVGPTICYAFLQSCGMVNDHLVDCFRYSAA